MAELQDRVKIQAGKAGTRGPVLFDRVLVDAPCTGTGVLAKRSDLRWRRTMGEMRVRGDGGCGGVRVRVVVVGDVVGLLWCRLQQRR